MKLFHTCGLFEPIGEFLLPCSHMNGPGYEDHAAIYFAATVEQARVWIGKKYGGVIYGVDADRVPGLVKVPHRQLWLTREQLPWSMLDLVEECHQGPERPTLRAYIESKVLGT